MSTGLALEEVSGLERPLKVALAEWHMRVAGSNEGRSWLPGRIRRLPLEARLMLATDADKALAWEARERRRVELSLRYFTAEYGAVQPEEGPPIPFELWPEQIDVLAAFEEHLRNIILKARQLGLTWLALHYALWLMAFCPTTENARILALSKKGTDADKLTERTRKLNELLPPFLRQRESHRTKESNSRFKIVPRGSELLSLMGTPEAALGETATLVIPDEFAHYPNEKAGKTWTNLEATMGARGRAVVIFTGNGRAGNGAAAANLWDRSASGETALNPIFLRYDVHPDRRRPGWREEKRKEYLTDEDFESMYPEDEDQALQSAGAFNVYSHAAIAAAEKLGRALDEQLQDLVFDEDGVEWGIDWGDFETFAVYAVPLGRGGVYVFDELRLPHTEPTEASERIIYRDPAGVFVPRFTSSFADSNPKGTNRTFGRVLREAHNAQPERFPDSHRPVPFSRYKEGGGERKGVNTVAYVQSLLTATEKFDGEPDEATGVLAISPRCKMLLAQMRNLERDADTGKVRKPALDPRHAERGDHGPDALVALLAVRAAKFRAEVNA